MSKKKDSCDETMINVTEQSATDAIQLNNLMYYFIHKCQQNSAEHSRCEIPNKIFLKNETHMMDS